MESSYTASGAYRRQRPLSIDKEKPLPVCVFIGWALSGDGMMRNFFVIALLISACLLGACARKLRVELHAIAEPGDTQQAGRLAGQRCLVLPAKPDANPDDLQFRAFSAQISASLAQKGCAPAQGLEDADLAVLLAYGATEPFIVEEHRYVMYRRGGFWSREMPDYVPVTITHILKTCSLSLDARLVEKDVLPSAGTQKGDAASGAKTEAGAKLGRQVWKIDAAHTGGQRVDLRTLFPWLLAAAKEYYGVNSGQNILIKVSEEDLISAPLPVKNSASPSKTDALEAL